VLQVQAQAAQQRLRHVNALQSYGQVTTSLIVNHRESYFASVQMELVIIYSVLLLICRVFFS
jgi:hypothetical protein